jgi:hypothetical protein
MANIHVALNRANREYEKEEGVFNRNDSDERAYTQTRNERQVSFMLSLSEYCLLNPARTFYSGR